jgi:O-antigen/teichoic acid export membrane protein
LLSSRLKQRWKMIASLGGIWLIILFPIPFFPMWGLPIDPTSLRTLLIITAIITIPFTLLAIFMNEGNNGRSSVRVD